MFDIFSKIKTFLTVKKMSKFKIANLYESIAYYEKSKLEYEANVAIGKYIIKNNKDYLRDYALDISHNQVLYNFCEYHILENKLQLSNPFLKYFNKFFWTMLLNKIPQYRRIKGFYLSIRNIFR